MDVNLLLFLVPIGSVAFFMLFERLALSHRIEQQKILPILAIQGLNIALSLGLSAGLLVPFVMLVAPLQVFSFSDWQVPIWVSFTASILFLDSVHYLLHYLSHKIPLLWRLHRLHHSDTKVDALTTFLHHPLELALTFFVVVLSAVLFDVPTVVIAVYSAIFSAHAAFTHINYELPEKVDRLLRWFIVTPNLHRLHHSQDLQEGNSNFGAIFTFADHVFSTFLRAQKGPASARFGISKKQSPRANSLNSYLLNPLK
jgi:sterol desaturase/sphingolipid hydroxylase (fatty acid hydroxylase superfamily)